ncbi:hypothetical protein CL622_01255 [archaeon]|nr:hypothetical protein [archaeon]
MEVRFTKHFFTVLVVFVLLLFLSGFILGRVTQKTQLSDVDSFLKQSDLKLQSYVLEQYFLEEFDTSVCSVSRERLQDLATQLGTIGRQLARDDTLDQIPPIEYDYLKRNYHLTQIRFYLQSKQLKEECGLDPNVILFFYNPDDAASTAQGLILDELVEELGITVLAVQAKYSDDIAFIESHFDLEKTPTLIIDYNSKLEGYKTLDELRSYMAARTA